MEKLLIILSLISFKVIAQEAEDYTQSSCYKKYDKVYQDGVAHNKKVRETNRWAAGYGVQLTNNKTSDWGHDEKTVMNTASSDNAKYIEVVNGEVRIKEPTFKPYLNKFIDLYTKVEKKFPNIEPEKVTDIIQKGFLSGDFCDKFLFFPTRKSIGGVTRYVKRKIEESMTRKLAIEINTDQRDDQEKESEASSTKAKSSATKVSK